MTDVLGLWWPAADADGLRAAAVAWTQASIELNRAVEVGASGAGRARARWSGGAAARFDEAWREHQQALRDDAVGCLAIADGLARYADAVADARRRVEELAVTAGATIAVGIGLAWLTFGTTAAVAGAVSAGLVEAAAAIGVELSSTAAAIGGTALTGAVFGAGEAAVVDMAITQPLRVEVFDDGGYSAPEAVRAMVDGGLFGGALGGASAVGAVAPVARIAAGDLGGVRFPGGALRAAMDPTNWGPRGSLFQVGVRESPGAVFKPVELPTARYLAGKGADVHARPEMGHVEVKSPDALVRWTPRDSGTYTEFKAPQAMSFRSVMRSLREAEAQLSPWGGGEVVVDGRSIGLTGDVASGGLERALKAAAKPGGDPIPDRIRIILGNGSELRYVEGGARRVH